MLLFRLSSVFTKFLYKIVFARRNYPNKYGYIGIIAAACIAAIVAAAAEAAAAEDDAVPAAIAIACG